MPCNPLYFPNYSKVAVPGLKKLPDEQCQQVPGVNCFLELVDVEEPQCFEVSGPFANTVLCGESGGPRLADAATCSA